MLSIKSRFLEKMNNRPASFSSFTEDTEAINDYPADKPSSREKWICSLKQVLPLYIGFNVACAMISLLSLMSTQATNDPRSFPLYLLWQPWHHWDTGWYITIAQRGYFSKEYTAFFPLYPLLMRGTMYLIHNPLLAGMFVANIAMLLTFLVFYRLVSDDFGPERAQRAVLYMAVVPTGFFLAAAYSTSLSISLALLCFYHMRQGKWWQAATFGLLASFTRSAGVLLVFPFLYEYLRQREFNWRRIRVDIASIVLIPIGIGIFGLYCYYRFGDFLAFSHVEMLWGRRLEVPWYGIVTSIDAIRVSPGILSYQSLNNLLNLIPDLFFLLLGILGFVGPWRFPRNCWSYALYAVIFWLFVNLVPTSGWNYPLASLGRYLLESFPSFIFLAAWGKNRFFHFIYFSVCGPLFVYLLFHHLLGLPVI
jgi:hypothetical protein